MRFLIVVVAFAALAQADRDLSKFTPKAREVFPNGPPPKIPRVVNGEEANPHQFPFMAALFIDGRSFCGGSILNANKILSAAHCCDGARSIKVVVGGHNIKHSEQSQQEILAKSVDVHDGWDPVNIANDVCVITLSADINLDGKTTSAIPLDQSNEHHVGATAVVSGWGRPSDSSGAISPVLRHTNDQIISNDECKRSFDIVTDGNICMNGKNGKSACKGDSGGPLAINGIEVGIVSFGSSFGCSIGYPSVYARISSFRSWIEQRL